MSRNKEAKAKMDSRSRLMEYCYGCMARLIRLGCCMESVIAVCRDLAMKKLSPQGTGETVN